MVTFVYFVIYKNNHKGLNPTNGNSPFFIQSKNVLSDSNDFFYTSSCLDNFSFYSYTCIYYDVNFLPANHWCKLNYHTQKYKPQK